MLELILAQTIDAKEMAAAVREAFHRPPAWNDKFFGTLWVVFGVVAIGWVVYRVWPRRKSAAEAAISAFEAISTFMRFSRTEVNDIRTLARAAKLAHPASVLLSPGNFNHAMKLAAPALESCSGMSMRLRKFEGRFFGSSTTAASTPSQAAPTASSG